MFHVDVVRILTRHHICHRIQLAYGTPEGTIFAMDGFDYFVLEVTLGTTAVSAVDH